MKRIRLNITVSILPVIILFIWINTSCCNKIDSVIPDTVQMSEDTLMNKIKGAWAGKVIGCSYGGQVEFKFNGTMIPDYFILDWPEGKIRNYFDAWPGLYDDIYVNLTFMEVYDRLGMDAPADSLAFAFAYSEYPLWHANQAARYNIMHGIIPPASGHWTNNPHADDIDFQIEADFAGIMSPGMPNTSSEISDKVGHIMNYGDGWYGGVYVAAMYTLAFILNDMELVVTEALKTIPDESTFHQCMSDIIRWHKQFPDDWKQTWFECERKWTQDMYCPEGVYVPFNIDAKVNCAYVLIGLLYGEGDFTRTIDIATRCGQDADCNPATAAGILGTILGYEKIPDYWKKNLKEVEDRNFAFSNISMNKAYLISFNHALQIIEKNGGSINGDRISIVCQRPLPVAYECAFEGHYANKKIPVYKKLDKPVETSFDGIGFALRGDVRCPDQTYIALVECYLDGELMEKAELPVSEHARRYELFWKFQLPKKRHHLSFKWLNPRNDAAVNLGELVVYSDEINKNNHY